MDPTHCRNFTNRCRCHLLRLNCALRKHGDLFLITVPSIVYRDGGLCMNLAAPLIVLAILMACAGCGCCSCCGCCKHPEVDKYPNQGVMMVESTGHYLPNPVYQTPQYPQRAAQQPQETKPEPEEGLDTNLINNIV